MLYLLDTNIVSELRKPKPHDAVSAWFNAQGMGTHHISSVSVYEMQAGAERTRAQDHRKASELDSWIAAVTARIAVLPLGSVEARMTAYLMRHEPKELLIDAMIAATALVHGLTVATRNTRDFERFQVALKNPFEYRG